MTKQDSTLYPYCTATEFKTDINQLCEHCPIRAKIANGLTEYITPQVRAQQEVLTPDQFNAYISDEVKDAQHAMQKAQQIELQQAAMNGPKLNAIYRKERILHYLWNKERIKLLNQLAVGDKAFVPLPPPAPTPDVVRSIMVNKNKLSSVLEALRPNFPNDQHPDLEKLLKGERIPILLAFQDNGNQLTDAFKQLYEKRVITGCTRAELQEWVVKHFTFYNNRTRKQQRFKADTVERNISGDRHCKNPIITVKITDDNTVIVPVAKEQKKIKKN
jgi:hypothetical protein